MGECLTRWSLCWVEVAMAAMTLGRFGDRRLEKGGPFCRLGLLKRAATGSACDVSVAIAPARSA